MTLLKELIDIPEQVHRGDFVLKLAEGLSHADATVDNYVVTPQLEKCFDEALGFIKSAVEGNSSKACYLHGSFGSGKSHFMAVLHLLLAGNTRARSIKELAKVVARHNAWTQGRQFLLVPYHMIGARDMESAILGQYAAYVRSVHPDAPVPGFYLAETLFGDAEGLRRRWATRRSSASSTKGPRAATAAGASWKAGGTPPASRRRCWSRPAGPSASAWSAT